MLVTDHTHTPSDSLSVASYILVAIIFSINAWFSGGAKSKINRDKCLKIWGSKIYLEINAWTPGQRSTRDTDANVGRTSAHSAIFLEVRFLWLSRLR